MQTVFCLFRNINAAQTAVEQLMGMRYSKNDLNIIVQAQSAKNALEVTSRASNIPVTGDGNQEKNHALSAMLRGNQPVPVPCSGKVLSVGELANVLIKSAAGSATGQSPSDLDWALKDFGIPKKTAESFTEGIKGGGLLLFVRTRDEDAADVAGALRKQSGENFVTSVGR